MDLLVGGISLLGIVFGLVEFLKKLKVTGNWLTVASMFFGTAIGVGYKFAIDYDWFGKWFGYAIFGLAIGLAASGVYDFINNRVAKTE